MPVIKSAIKKLRQDKRRTETNNKIRREVEISVNKASKETKEFRVIAHAYSAIDKAVKKNIIDKNKAARMKSSLAKQVKPQLIKPTNKTGKKSVPHA